MTDFDKTVKQIASCLDGWETVPSADWYCAIGKGRAKIIIKSHSRASLSFHAVFPQGKYVNNLCPIDFKNSINISMAKPPGVIAKSLNKRLIKEYLIHLGVAFKKKEEEDKQAELAQFFAAQCMEVMGIDPKGDWKKNDTYYLNKYLGDANCKVEIHDYDGGEKGNIHIDRICKEKILRILKIVME